MLIKLFDTRLVHEVYIRAFAAVEYDPHHSLTASNRAVGLSVNLLGPDSIPCSHEGIEYVFAEVLTFYVYSFGLRVLLRVKGCKCVNSIAVFCHTSCDRLRVQSKHTSTSNNTNLWSSGNEHLDFFVFEAFLDFTF